MKLIIPLYNKDTAKFLGLTKKLAYIVLKVDEEAVFFSYGHDEENSKLLYSYAKERIPNAVTSTCFNKHFYEILNERRDKEEFSTLFYYLSSTTDRKEKINQFKETVNLSPIDCSLEFLNLFSSDELFNFWPDYLTSAIPEQRDPQVQTLYKFFSHMAKVSNDNSIRNADHLLTKNTNTY